MIYRILLRSLGKFADDNDEFRGFLNQHRLHFALIMSDAMGDMGFKAPKSRVNHKGRFYFTDRGWDEFGRHLLAIAIRRGYKPKVIRLKNPKASDVSYWDSYQVCLLPRRKEQ